MVQDGQESWTIILFKTIDSNIIFNLIHCSYIFPVFIHSTFLQQYIENICYRAIFRKDTTLNIRSVPVMHPRSTPFTVDQSC